MLANNIKKARQRKGLTQSLLGEKIGVIHATVSNYETGRVVPNAEMLQKIASELEVSMEQLLSDIDYTEVKIDATKSELKISDLALELILKQQEMLLANSIP